MLMSTAELNQLRGFQVLVEYRNKDPNHVEWAKAIKELYTPDLRDHVKAHYALGPVWSATGKTIASAPSSSPAPPPAPSASLFSSGTSQPSSSNSGGMSAVFRDISAGTVTAELRKVTDDMKTKNRADRAGAVTTTEKESRTASFSSAKAGPPKLELQMDGWLKIRLESRIWQLMTATQNKLYTSLIAKIQFFRSKEK